MKEATIRGLFEAYLETSCLSPEDIVSLIRVAWEENRKVLAQKFYEIRDEYLENIQSSRLWNEPDVEDYINMMWSYIN